MHLGRAALIFWVAAIMLPAAVQQTVAVPTGTSGAGSQQSTVAALHGVADAAGDGRDRVAALTAHVHGTEDEVRGLVARVRLETERFIAQLP